MDKSIKINLAGSLFQIDQDAYYILRDYLQAVNNRFQNVHGGNETIDDIEARIAEIFNSQQNFGGVITKANVEAMIGIIGKPEDFDIPEHQTVAANSASYRKRLYRNPDDSIISGVCGGIAAYLNTDPVWIRISFILFSIFFGIGFFIYLALWIAIPKAWSETQKRELYGKYYNNRNIGSETFGANGNPEAVGVFGEIFNAIGKFFYIVFRIFMIILGILLVTTGFISLLAFSMVLFTRFPGLISLGSFNSNIFFVHDFLNYVINPTLTPWIIGLTAVALILPLLAIIYWGIKMIFWFSVKDGVVSLIFFIIWALSIASLSIILFNEGVSFSETGTSSSQDIIQNHHDTLFIVTGKKVKDLSVKKEFSLPENQYSMVISDADEQLAVRAKLRLFVTSDKSIKIDVRKRTSDRTRIEAVRKACDLTYNYKLNKDTLYLDEYFRIPSGRKWAADEIRVNLFLPEKTVLYFDNSSENLLPEKIFVDKGDESIMIHSRNYTDIESWQLGNKYWIVTEDGLAKTTDKTLKEK